MLYKAKVASCSEIRTQHPKAMWVPCRIFEYQTRWYTKQPLGFKSLGLSAKNLQFILR
jgi:hypothetical protein